MQELSLEPKRAFQIVAQGNRLVGGNWTHLFDPFVGHWVGGDLHDAGRAFQHIWYPAAMEGDLLAQPVMMIPGGTADSSPIWAYNFGRPADDQILIRGVVGQQALVGFLLEEGVLLWIGEEPEGWTSAHLERIWAKGQLYDIRGLVFRVAPDGRVEALPSDWRYHRVAPGAIALPLTG